MTKPSPSLQPRDEEILRFLYEARCATIDQLSKLFFNSGYSAAQKRIKKLRSAGYLGQKKPAIGKPNILFISQTGYDHFLSSPLSEGLPLVRWESLRKRIAVSPLTLDHELKVIDALTQITVASRAQEGKIIHATSWPKLCQFEAMRTVIKDGFKNEHESWVKPDGYFHLEIKDQPHRFYFELDNSTRSLDALLCQATGYHHRYYSGSFAKDSGALQGEYKKFPFRVLYVLGSKSRRNNLAEMIINSQPRIRSLIWLSTFDEVSKNPFDKLWAVL